MPQSGFSSGGILQLHCRLESAGTDENPIPLCSSVGRVVLHVQYILLND